MIRRWDRCESTAPATRDTVVRVAACGLCGSDLRYIAMGGVAVGDRVVVNPGNNDVSHIGNVAARAPSPVGCSCVRRPPVGVGMSSDRIPLEDWDRVAEMITGPPSFAKIMVTMD